MALEFDKLEDSCSNVYLIDERLCLKNSYQIINKNTETIFNNLNFINKHANNFNLLYANFASNSAKWIRAIDNFQTLSAAWISAETTVYNLSANWQKEVTFIYNKIIDITAYNSSPLTYKTQIASWLNTNFKDLLPDKQTINVEVVLSFTNSFAWPYFKSYYENCVPPTTSITGNCDCPKPNYNCNYIWNTVTGQFLSSCNNVGKFCTYESQEIVGFDNIKCPNRGAQQITFSKVTGSSDKSICRVITIKYYKVNNTITLI